MARAGHEPRDAGGTGAAARLAPLGEEALRVALPDEVDRAAALAALRAVPGVTEAWMGEAHAAVRFSAPPDPAALLAAVSVRGAAAIRREVRVRVVYDGYDLARVAAWAGLSPEEVAALHAGRPYEVRFLGFLPGFAYLGDVDPRIAAPRLEAPRPRVPAGAVALAGARTGVYPSTSPGGWNLIGRAIDFVAFDEARGATLAPGDRVVFEVG